MKNHRGLLFSAKVWYVTTFIQFLWMIILYMGWLTLSGYIEKYLTFIGADKPETTATYQLPNWLGQPLLIMVIAGLTVFTIYVISRTPRKTGEVTIRSTTTAAKHIEPQVEKALARSRVTRRIAKRETPFIALLILNITIFLITIPMHFFITEISSYVIWVVSIFLLIVVVVTLGIWRLHVYRRS